MNIYGLFRVRLLSFSIIFSFRTGVPHLNNKSVTSLNEKKNVWT